MKIGLALAAMRFARRLGQTPALQPYFAEEYRPGVLASSDDDLLEFAPEYGQTISIHPARARSAQIL